MNEYLTEFITSPTRVFETLQSLGHGPNPLLGQNFLIDANIQRYFVHSLEIDEDSQVVEIGPGLGHLTRAILDTGAKVLAIEKDHLLAKSLAEHLNAPPNLDVWDRDVLEVTLGDLLEWGEGKSVVIMGNLPYYCSAQVLAKLFEEWLLLWEKAGFLFQEEVADRIVSAPGHKSFGRLSLLAQIFSTPRKMRRIPPHVFVPAPEVFSAWCVFCRGVRQGDPAQPHPPAPSPMWRGGVTPTEVSKVSAICFAERRKTLQNNLGKALGREVTQQVLTEVGVDGKRRAEELEVAEFISLVQAVIKHLER
jgi:16S rRNA (adenine1518-N6/adenine1519-N6)-dimethyltransferase